MSIALPSNSFSPIRYLNRVSWDNYLEMIVGGFSRTIGTVGIVMISFAECANAERRERLTESIIQRRRRKLHELPSCDKVRMLGLRVNQDGSFSTVIDTLKAN
jgi:hypothetical protein